jgi:Na+/H+ antiporter NhaD/arsenite permease-like protein
LLDPATKLELEVRKASFMAIPIALTGEDFARRGESFFLYKDVSLPRFVGAAFWIALLIFLGVYLLISLEILHRTVATMLGAALMVGVSHTLGSFDAEYRILSFQTAVHKVDVNMVLLFMGMMIIVGILKHTGVFQWAAFKCLEWAGGRVLVLALMISLAAGATSALLDNVTTMLLFTPATIAMAQSLKLNPLELLVPEVMAANVGGAATLVGDAPNMMIGSYADLTFADFLGNLAPVCGLALVALGVMTAIYHRGVYARVPGEDLEACARRLREEYRITDRVLLAYGAGILALTVALFLSHGFWEMSASVAAMLGASILFTYGILSKRVRMLEFIEKDMEWPTLLFFIFLFAMVGGLEETGLLAMVGDRVLGLSQGNLTVAVCLVLWISALVSAFVDNIPFTATMLPVVAYLTQAIPGAESNVLWWAFALGVSLGASGTVLGGSANVVTMGMAESAGYPISFARFMRFGLVYMLVSVGMCNAWLLMRY